MAKTTTNNEKDARQVSYTIIPPDKGYFEDFEVGAKYITPEKVLTSTEMDLYCLATGHRQHHLDVRLAKSLGFKDKIAAGLFNLSQIDDLMIQIGLLNKATLNLGHDNVRYMAIVYPGDSIKLEVEVIGKKEVAKWKDKGIVTFKILEKNQDNVVVLEAENSQQIKHRNPLS